jgi:hypothetical protein
VRRARLGIAVWRFGVVGLWDVLCIASVRVFVIYAYSNHEYLHVKTFFPIEQFDKSCGLWAQIF